MKQVIWLGSSLERIKGFPANVRKEAGRQLMRVQSGLEPTAFHKKTQQTAKRDIDLARQRFKEVR